MTPEKFRYEGLEEDLASFGPAGHVRNWVPDKDFGALGPNVDTELEAEGRLMGPGGLFFAWAEGGRWFLLRPGGFYSDRMVLICSFPKIGARGLILGTLGP